VESMWDTCDGQVGPASACPFDAVQPSGLILRPGQRVQVAAFDDQSFGFLRITLVARRLHGEFFSADARALTLVDSFTLDLETHRVEGRAL